jgi:hypothetical protein
MEEEEEEEEDSDKEADKEEEDRVEEEEDNEEEANDKEEEEERGGGGDRGRCAGYVPSCSSLLSLAAAGSSPKPSPNRSVSFLCLKEMTAGLRVTAPLAGRTSSSDRSDRSSALTGNTSCGCG